MKRGSNTTPKSFFFCFDLAAVDEDLRVEVYLSIVQREQCDGTFLGGHDQGPLCQEVDEQAGVVVD